jgi:uncharacterized protein Veg
MPSIFTSFSNSKVGRKSHKKENKLFIETYASVPSNFLINWVKSAQASALKTGPTRPFIK